MGTKVKVVFASTILIVALTALAFNRHASIVPQVHAEETEACTDQTLVGRYGFTGEGFFATSNTFLPAADVGVFVSDGQGKISGSDTLSSGGQIASRTFMATYKVNSDCTGTAALQFNGLAVDVAIVLDDRGREVRALQTNPQGAVFTVLARKDR
jgi:cephalosporin-C deacetylase-like acetyl esterase